ncbi:MULTISPECIES: bleomycin resistance protein [Actinomadura]|uniref:Bleomycin resistance protein n=1 Tax=Actinomadura yumaensis TaxID=111807 RepID=A0ABW2CRK6_9ACTN|nr:VOC family protein [Actinomadura sp. J1-007]
MAEKTIPILPSRSIQGAWDFYRVLGFERTTWQTSPNPYLSVLRGDIELHFYGWKKHDPSASMTMCYIVTDAVDPLYESFRGGLKEALGRVPTRGLPRIGPLKDMTYGMRQFLVSDPDGNQLRIGQQISDDLRHAPIPEEKVARSLHMALLLGESKEDPRAAARILDHLLNSGEPLTAPQRLRALVLRADMAVRLDDPSRARTLLAEARATTSALPTSTPSAGGAAEPDAAAGLDAAGLGAAGLDDAEASGMRDDLRRLEDLESFLS